jgi:hypothetical protein
MFRARPFSPFGLFKMTTLPSCIRFALLLKGICPYQPASRSCHFGLVAYPHYRPLSRLMSGRYGRAIAIDAHIVGEGLHLTSMTQLSRFTPCRPSPAFLRFRANGSHLGYLIVPVKKRECQRCWLTQLHPPFLTCVPTLPFVSYIVYDTNWLLSACGASQDFSVRCDGAQPQAARHHISHLGGLPPGGEKFGIGMKYQPLERTTHIHENATTWQDGYEDYADWLRQLGYWRQ